MAVPDLLELTHGRLTVYLAALRGTPALEAFVQGVPRGMPVVWLDSAREHPVTGRWSIVGYDPWLTLRTDGDRVELTTAASRVVREHPLEALRQVLRRYRAPARGSVHGRAVGLLGFLSYDLNRWIERLPAPRPGAESTPEMLWFGMRVVVLVDHLQRRSWLVSVVDPHSPPGVAARQAREALEDAAARLEAAGQAVRGAPRDLLDPSEARRGRPRELPAVHPTSTQAEFERMVARALDFIRQGDIFQANVAQRFTATCPEAPLGLSLRLRELNPSPFACYLACGPLAVVSSSPERLVLVEDGTVTTRPIAGTRPRGATATEDTLNSLDLLLSDKERAEHIMLVDLARNDLGRVCRTGSVGVDELMALEHYSHVIHIVSDVRGALRPKTDAVDVIRAIFPGGTITGCPKIRCMEILRELEPVARGLYTGSLGVLGFDGSLELNIAIRTMVLEASRLTFHVGAGIVADSDPTREYQETLDKAKALVAALARPDRLAPTADAPRR